MCRLLVRPAMAHHQGQKKGKGQTPPTSPRLAHGGADKAARMADVFQATAAVLQNGAQLDLDMSARDDLWYFITRCREWSWASADTANASLFGVVADAVRRFVATPMLAQLFESESPHGESDVEALQRLVYKLPISRDEYVQLGVGPLRRMVAKVLRLDLAAGRAVVEMEGHGTREFSVPISSDLLTPVRPQVVQKWTEYRDSQRAAAAERDPEAGCVPMAIYQQAEEAAGPRRPAVGAGPAGRPPGEFLPPRPFASIGPTLGKCGHSRPQSGLLCDTCQSLWEGQEQRAAPSEGQSMCCPHCKHPRLPIDAPICPWCRESVIEAKGPPSFPVHASDQHEGWGKQQGGAHEAWIASLPLHLRLVAQRLGKKDCGALRGKQFVPILKFAEEDIGSLWAITPVKRHGRLALDPDHGVVEDDSHLDSKLPKSIGQFLQAVRLMIDLYCHAFPECAASIREYGEAVLHREGTTRSMLGDGQDALTHLFLYDKAHRSLHAITGSVAFGNCFQAVESKAQAELATAAMRREFRSGKRQGDELEEARGGGPRTPTKKQRAAGTNAPSAAAAEQGGGQGAGLNHPEYLTMDQGVKDNIKQKRLCIAFNTVGSCNRNNGHMGYKHLCAKCLKAGHGLASCE